MKTILHVLDVHAPRRAVFDALTKEDGLAGWWSTSVAATSAMGGIVHFTFGGDFNPDMEIVELEDPAHLTWRRVGGHEPWIDNTFRFELEERGEHTRLRFRQDYARELTDDEYGIYNFNWSYYMESLRLLCTTGAGSPHEPQKRPSPNPPVPETLAPR